MKSFNTFSVVPSATDEDLNYILGPEYQDLGPTLNESQQELYLQITGWGGSGKLSSLPRYSIDHGCKKFITYYYDYYYYYYFTLVKNVLPSELLNCVPSSLTLGKIS